MAEMRSKYVQQVLVNEEVIWANHYSSNHQILLVGEGDFSFSLSLASSFGSASNIVASSLDSYDDVIKKYRRAKTNLVILRGFGAQLLHGVDATKMHLHTDLRMRKFDRIIYNFPHAGFLGKEDNNHVIMMHQKLVRGFFKNASHMLRANGEVHVTHKTNSPYDRWNIKELAAQNCLALVECVEFKLEDYPGYNNKRGEGSRCDKPFHPGKCVTFKFILLLTTKKQTNLGCRYPQQPQQIPLQIVNASMVMNPAPVGNHFREYFDYARLMYGQTDEILAYAVLDALRIRFERYKAENCGNPLSDYINLSEEVQNLCKQLLAFLRVWLLRELVRQHGL